MKENQIYEPIPENRSGGGCSDAHLSPATTLEYSFTDRFQAELNTLSEDCLLARCRYEDLRMRGADAGSLRLMEEGLHRCCDLLEETQDQVQALLHDPEGPRVR